MYVKVSVSCRKADAICNNFQFSFFRTRTGSSRNTRKRDKNGKWKLPFLETEQIDLYTPQAFVYKLNVSTGMKSIHLSVQKSRETS